MSFTLHNLSITKFFDVKTPIGINQRNESIDNYSIGIDLYMPLITTDFLNAIIEANKKLYPDLYYIEDEDSINFTFISENDSNVILDIKVFDKNLKTGRIKINKKVQIPTGIGMIIPKNIWCEVRTKSSNFQNSYTEVHGTVDMNYTYGVGAQIIPLDKSIIYETNEKFTQLVFHEAVPVLEINEIPLNKWSELDEVKFRREKRIGGFGSQGKFDK